MSQNNLQNYSPESPNIPEAEKLVNHTNQAQIVRQDSTPNNFSKLSKLLVIVFLFTIATMIISFFIFIFFTHSSDNSESVRNDIHNISAQDNENSSLQFLTNINTDQKNILNRFKKMVVGNLTHEYMKRDLFLIPWLQEKEWDVEEAQEFLMESLEWRKEYKIDGILDEDFADFSEEFAFNINGFDKEGRPILILDMSAWDVRKAVVAGKGEHLMRFVFNRLETGAKLIRDAQSSGKNVTQMIVLVDTQGFNMVQHACLQCISINTRFATALMYNYPGILYKVIMINVPEGIDFVLELLIPSELEHLTEMYGINKSVWQPEILRYINKDQITTQFGGTRNDTDYDV